MDLFEVIKARASVRNFTSTEVSDEDIMKMLEAAVRAPTAGNLQPWFFYVVKQRELKDSLAQAALGQKFIANAPVIIVACTDPEVSARIHGNRGRYLYCLQDVAAAVENMMMAAVPLGLGTCWIGAFEEEKVAGILDMPDGRRPLALVPVGYPGASVSSPSRKPVESVVEFK